MRQTNQYIRASGQKQELEAGRLGRCAPRDAMRLQSDLRGRVARRDDFGAIRYVAGADMAISSNGRRGYGGVVVFEYPSLIEVERRIATENLRFPYVPGLLSFRELPVLLRAFAKLKTTPDVILFDGQGIAHPRRIGLASHAGLVLDKPTIGCAKSRLIGEADAPGERVGDWTPLTDEGEVIGAVLRTRRGVKPIYVSIGHRISLKSAIRIVLNCSDGLRIPRPTREADHYVAAFKRAHS